MAAAGGELVRAAEWRRVREFVTGTSTRTRPAALAVTGEAGAGKSTLWRAGTKAAADAGCRVLHSEPTASEANSSFAALFDLLAVRTKAPADPLTVGAPPLPHGWHDLLAAVPAAGHVTLAPLDTRQIRKLLPPAVTGPGTGGGRAVSREPVLGQGDRGHPGLPGQAHPVPRRHEHG
jgi:hypothetical protein